jgi:O-antigen/teichoic acid export membrane protein
VWSLVAGGIVSGFAKVALSHTALPGRADRLGFDKPAYDELVAFGKWIFVSTAITFLSLQIDRLLLGHMVPLDELGVYGTAQQLSALPMTIFVMMAGAIVYPVISAAVRSDPTSVGALTGRIREVLLPCGLFMILGLALLAPAFFRTLYDELYAEASWIVVALMVPLWFLLLTQSADRTLMALGDTRALAVCNAASLAGKIAGCLVGFRIGGLPGFILGLTAGTAVGHLVVQWMLRVHGISIWKQDALHSGLALAGGAVALFLQRAVVTRVSAAWSTAAEVAVALLVLVPTGLLTWKHVRRNWPR